MFGAEMSWANADMVMLTASTAEIREMVIDPLEIDFDSGLTGAGRWKIRIFWEASSVRQGPDTRWPERSTYYRRARMRLVSANVAETVT